MTTHSRKATPDENFIDPGLEALRKVRDALTAQGIQITRVKGLTPLYKDFEPDVEGVSMWVRVYVPLLSSARPESG